MDADQEDIARLEAKVDQLTLLVGQLVERNQRQAELIDEAVPIAKEVMDWATVKLDAADQAGWFALGREGLGVLEAVVEAYEPEDIRALSEGVVTLLEGVRSVTQPEVMALLAEAGEAIQHGDELEPVTPLEVLKAGRDPEVQRGLAVMVEVLRQVGRATKSMHPLHAQDSGKERRARLLAKRLAERGSYRSAAGSAPPVARSAKVASAVEALQSTSAAETMAIPGYALDAQGYLLDPQSWTEDYARQMARALGVPELGPRHWELLRYARQRFAESGDSPDIRALTASMGISTKELYGLWPAAPGTTTARVAGLPKPVGCI